MLISSVTKVFHPNVDESSGSICLDVINSKWTPMYNLINVFSVLIPQLLVSPNSSDPLNREAAELHLKNEKAYAAKVREYVKKFAIHPESNGTMDTSPDGNSEIPIPNGNGFISAGISMEIDGVDFSDSEPETFAALSSSAPQTSGFFGDMDSTDSESSEEDLSGTIF